MKKKIVFLACLLLLILGIGAFQIVNPGGGSGGGISSITFSSPLTGGTITTSGTVGLGTVPPANGGVAQSTTTGQMGITPGIGEYIITTVSEAVSVSAANQVRAIQFTLPKQQAFNKATWWVNASAGDTVDYAIYSSDGTTKLVEVGATVTVGAGAVQTVTSLATSATLNPGTYFFAWTQTGTPSTTLQLLPTSAGGMSSFLNTQTQKRFGTAANSATAGTLPSSLGAITPAAISAPQVFFEP